MASRKVTLINPPVEPFRKIMRNFDCATESKGNYLYQPYDFLLLTGKIPEHFEIAFYDFVADEIDFQTSINTLQNTEHDIIVCSLAATNWKQDFEFIKILKSKLQHNLLFVFGDLFIDKNRRLEIESYVSGILTSPVQLNFESLLHLNIDQYSSLDALNPDKLYSKKDLKNPTSYSLDLPRHSLIQHKKYRWPFSRHFRYTTVFTAWGCPYSCSYCILSNFPNYWRDYQEVFNELLEVKNLGFKEFYMGDRSFGLPLNNVKSLLKLMIDNKLNLQWSTYFHPNQYDEELLNLMKESGCHTIIVGVESYNLESLKTFGRHVRKNQFYSLIEHAKKINMQICGDFIIGLPEEDLSDIRKTIQFSIDLNLDFASFNIAAPLAGSVIKEMAQKNGSMSFDEENIDSLGKNKVISVGKLSPYEIKKLRNEAVFRFYMRPTYLFKRLIRIRSIEHLIIQLQEAFVLFSKSLGG